MTEGMEFMSFSLLPDEMADSVMELSPKWLKQRGIELLLLDFDNTLLSYSSSVPSKELLAWIGDLKRQGILIAVVSNSYKDRVPQFCREFDIPCIRKANKPSVRGILEAMKTMGVPSEKTALAGDQIFTDVLGANRSGILSILISPVELSNWFLRLRYRLERPFIYLAGKRGKRDE